MAIAQLPIELWQKIAEHSLRLGPYAVLMRHLTVDYLRHVAASRIISFFRSIERLPPRKGATVLLYTFPACRARRGVIYSITFIGARYTCTVQMSPSRCAFVYHKELYWSPAAYTMRVLPESTPGHSTLPRVVVTPR